MKKKFKYFSILLLIPCLASNAFAQEYDCNAENTRFRNNKNSWIIQDVNKPFSTSDISSFNGLFYFPIDCKYVYTGTLTKPGSMNVINVGTSKGGTVQVYDYGTVSVNIEGENYNLTVYKNIDMPEFGGGKGVLFIPIKDATSDSKTGSTYANGRYLVIKEAASGAQLTLDFNMAINPFENYNGNYSSLLVPASNVILAPIASGERKYEDR